MQKALPQDPIPVKPVDVYLGKKGHNDLKAIQKVTKDVLGRLGCPACHSGFDIRFRLFDAEKLSAPAFKADPKSLEVSELDISLR